MKSCKHNFTQKLFYIANISISLLSIIVAIFSVLYTTANNKRINAIEYKISDNFKSEILEMVLALYSIKDKLEYKYILDVKDISSECEKLAALRLSPGYLLMMLSFKSEQDFLKFDNKLQHIIDFKSSIEYDKRRQISNYDLMTKGYDQSVTEINSEKYIDEIKEIYEILFNNIDNFVVKAKFENLNQIKSFIEKNIDKDN